MKKLIWLIIPVILSCQPKHSTPVEDINAARDSLLTVYIEILSEMPTTPTPPATLMDSSRVILEKNGLTYKQYRRAISYLNADPEHWEIFYQEAMDSLKSKLKTTSPPPVIIPRL